MDPLELAEIGKTGLKVSRLGVGGVAIGRTATAEESDETLKRCVELGVRYFDTAPLYGGGVSEKRYGEVLSSIPRSSFTISTKVGRLLEAPAPTPVGAVIGPGGSSDMPYIYDYDTVMRVFEGSLKRLNLDNVDILLIHDPDSHFQEAMDGAYRALSELRSQGVVKAIGAYTFKGRLISTFLSWTMGLPFGRSNPPTFPQSPWTGNRSELSSVYR